MDPDVIGIAAVVSVNPLEPFDGTSRSAVVALSGAVVASAVTDPLATVQ